MFIIFRTGGIMKKFILKILRAYPEKWLRGNNHVLKQHYEFQAQYGAYDKNSFTYKRMELLEKMTDCIYEICNALGSDAAPPPARH